MMPHGTLHLSVLAFRNKISSSSDSVLYSFYAAEMLPAAVPPPHPILYVNISLWLYLFYLVLRCLSSDTDLLLPPFFFFFLRLLFPHLL